MTKSYHCREGETVVHIIHGQLGYYMAFADIKTDADIAAINDINGVTLNEAIAAKHCSMFDCWDNFNALVKSGDKNEP